MSERQFEFDFMKKRTDWLGTILLSAIQLGYIASCAYGVSESTRMEESKLKDIVVGAEFSFGIMGVVAGMFAIKYGFDKIYSGLRRIT